MYVYMWSMIYIVLHIWSMNLFSMDILIMGVWNMYTCRCISYILTFTLNNMMIETLNCSYVRIYHRVDFEHGDFLTGF